CLYGWHDSTRAVAVVSIWRTGLSTCLDRSDWFPAHDDRHAYWVTNWPRILESPVARNRLLDLDFYRHERDAISLYRSSLPTSCHRVSSFIMEDPRITKLADVLVNYSTRVQPGDLVRLSGPALG